MHTENLVVCVLGANGFVGTAITEILKQRNIKWYGVDYSVIGKNVFSVECLKGNIIPQEIKKCTLFINCAGGLKPNTCEDDPDNALKATENNVEFICNLLLKTNVRKLLHISSAGTVYGENNGTPFAESDKLNPISVYGKVKVLEENILESFTKNRGIDYLCARLSNPYGNKKTKNHGLIDVLIKNYQEDKIINLYADRDPSRDYIS